MAGPEQPMILVQDYHFALLPRMIKGEATGRPHGDLVAHSWPNPEAFGICTQRR
jgi:trehalose-6-phosphate synthase